jgi:hypothetical protein
MGMTDKAVERGQLVAGNRYVVFVADMYGQGTRPADFGEAAQLGRMRSSSGNAFAPPMTL